MFNVTCCSRDIFCEWCVEHQIACEYKGTKDGIDTWYIADEKHRNWAITTWT